MTPFAEVRLEANLIIYGTQGGSGYNTNVVIVNSGFESRNKNWENSRGKWEFGERKVPSRELHSIEGFFRARRGRYQGFRFRDWGNYQVTHEPLTELNIVSQGVLMPLPLSDTKAQLYKKYSDVDSAYSTTFELRKISKPVLPTIDPDTLLADETMLPTIYKNNVLLEYGSQWGIDLSTGIVTYTSPFIDTDTHTWTGEFDTAVRFDTDEFKARFDSGLPTFDTPPQMSEVYFYLFSLPLIEIRVP